MATVGGLDLAEALRSRLWTEVLQPVDQQTKMGVESIAEQRIQVGHSGTVEAEIDFELA